MMCTISANCRRLVAGAKVVCLAALCVACTVAPPVPGGPLATTSEQIKTEVRLELAAGTTLAIANPYGDIHVRQSPEGELQLTLFLQRADHSKAQASIVQKSSALRQDLIVTAEPRTSRKEVLRIDLVVFVPPQPELSLTTHHGMIEVKKLSNPLLEASSDSGELRLTTGSVLHARSKTGRIRATIMQPGWLGESRISSDRGPIQVFLPLSTNLHLLATAGTSIQSEFTLEVNHHGKGSRAELNRGDGSDKLLVTNRKGEVHLYSVVVDPAAHPIAPEDDD